VKAWLALTYLPVLAGTRNASASKFILSRYLMAEPAGYSLKLLYNDEVELINNLRRQFHYTLTVIERINITCVTANCRALDIYQLTDLNRIFRIEECTIIHFELQWPEFHSRIKTLHQLRVQFEKGLLLCEVIRQLHL